MPTRNVNLTREMDRFVARSVKSGKYANASEVMRSAIRLLEREEREHEQRIEILRAAIREGDSSGEAEDGVFERLFSYIEELAANRDENVA